MGLKNLELLKNVVSAGSIPATWMDGAPYFDKCGAELLLVQCRKMGIAVIGIEGFIINGGDLIPQMDWIADLSDLFSGGGGVGVVEATIDCAGNFLRLPGYRDDIKFEFFLREVVRKG